MNAVPNAAGVPMEPVALDHVNRLLNHGPTVLVATAHGGRRNVMAAAWSMPVEFTPPRVAVVIDKNTFTRGLAAAAGAFALCIPGRGLADLTYTVGSCSGREGDKFERYGIQATPGPALGQPLVAGCVAWMECRLIPEPHTETAYDTCFAEVLWAAADPHVFHEGRWSFREDNTELHTLHHMGAGNFAWPLQVVQARKL